MTKLKKYTLICFILLISTVFVIYLCNKFIIEESQNKTYNSVEEIPENKVGFLLGTGKYLKNGTINPYYLYRINATYNLFKANKIELIVISGDNSTTNYNEPQLMMDDLVALGISRDKIYLDYAGFRTLDSIYRLHKIFGQQKFTIISQKFHNERAIYIAKYLGLDAIGYNAKDVSAKQGIKTNTREKLARVKVFIDQLFDKKPKFLGEKIILE